MTITATYSPEDNKLRLYASQRLEPELYARVRAAGFIWAPKQDLFVAPAWTPGRADLCEELAGSIDDEDTSLVDRAEQRRERFEDYSDKRNADAERAHSQVLGIMEHIPLGQPILVGHHSERHARKHAEQIENGTRRAVKMWETSKYWTQRAAGAIRHAKYKERPDVRHRRIKTIQTDQRREQKRDTEAREWITAWGRINAPTKDGSAPTPEQVRGRALQICNYQQISIRLEGAPDNFVSSWSLLNDGRIDVRTAQLRSLKAHARSIARARRWLQHFENRIAYERAMIGEAGGLAVQASDYPVQVGGRVRVGREWLTVLRLNRKAGELVSITTNRRYCRVVGIEEVCEVAPADVDAVKATKAAMKLPPMCNYPGEGFHEMTRAEWDRTYQDYKGSKVIAANEKHDRHRLRSVVKGYSGIAYVFLTDAPRKDAPEPPIIDPPPAPRIEPPAPDMPRELEAAQARAERRQLVDAERAADPLAQLAERVRHGGPIVQVVTAPQLFPTPAPVALQLVSRLERRHLEGRILEPSVGTGRLLDALRSVRGHLDRVYACELNPTLAQQVRDRYPVCVQAIDFTAADYGHMDFDAVIMNPPFKDASDIKHIAHAFRLLAPGGRLVSVVAAGPRQRQFIAERGGEWEDLPAGTFAEQGTNVNTAIVTLDAPEWAQAGGKLF